MIKRIGTKFETYRRMAVRQVDDELVKIAVADNHELDSAAIDLPRWRTSVSKVGLTSSSSYLSDSEDDAPSAPSRWRETNSPLR
jgi:hypothetical protein